MGRSLSLTDQRAVSRVLMRLRDEVGDIDFGFRAQGMLARAMSSCGVRVSAVNHQGHPDIVGNDQDGTVRVEVEACISRARTRTVASVDMQAIAPRQTGDSGYFIVLDVAPIAQWIAVEHTYLRDRIGDTLPLAVLSARRDRDFSDCLTRNLVQQTLAYGTDLTLYPLSRLTRMILRGNTLATD